MNGLDAWVGVRPSAPRHPPGEGAAAGWPATLVPAYLEALALLLGAGLSLFGLPGPCLGQLAPVGGQRLTRRHVLGHIGQPPGRGPGRVPQPLKGGLGIQLLTAHDHPLGLLDQPAMLQGGLELVGQPPFHLDGGRR
jgi:hypothetical protein